MSKYDPAKIEAKWARKWAQDQPYRAKDPDKAGQKYFALDMFPYPSGDLHIGHWYAFTPPDIHSRYQRMNGVDRNILVLHVTSIATLFVIFTHQCSIICINFSGKRDSRVFQLCEGWHSAEKTKIDSEHQQYKGAGSYKEDPPENANSF